MNRRDHELTPRMRRILRVLTPVVCPPEVDEFDLVEEVIAYYEGFLGDMPEMMRVAAEGGLYLFEFLAPLYPPNRGRLFSQLDQEAAERYFHAWWEGPVMPMREFAKKIKGLVVIGYYEQPEVKEAMEYHPEQWIAEVAERRLASYGEEIRRGEEAVKRPDPLVIEEFLEEETSRQEAG